MLPGICLAVSLARLHLSPVGFADPKRLHSNRLGAMRLPISAAAVPRQADPTENR
jgi:hypothetical protein